MGGARCAPQWLGQAGAAGGEETRSHSAPRSWGQRCSSWRLPGSFQTQGRRLGDPSLLSPRGGPQDAALQLQGLDAVSSPHEDDGRARIPPFPWAASSRRAGTPASPRGPLAFQAEDPFGEPLGRRRRRRPESTPPLPSRLLCVSLLFGSGRLSQRQRAIVCLRARSGKEPPPPPITADNLSLARGWGLGEVFWRNMWWGGFSGLIPSRKLGDLALSLPRLQAFGP